MPHSCMKVGLDGLGQNTIPQLEAKSKAAEDVEAQFRL